MKRIFLLMKVDNESKDRFVLLLFNHPLEMNPTTFVLLELILYSGHFPFHFPCHLIT